MTELAKTHHKYSLILEGLSKRYGRHIICQNVAWEMSPGDSVAVVGPNGSGKSTLLKIIAGLVRPDRGIVHHRFGSRPLHQNNWHNHIGLVSPELALYEELTGLENVRLADRLGRLASTARDQLALLDEFGLTGRGNDPVSTYSSGMKQRLKYCVACLKRPSLLLLDEPTANLDVEGIDRIWVALETRQSTVIIATNEPEEAARAHRQYRVGASGGWVTP